MEMRMNRYMELMKLDVRPEDVKCDAKTLFKTYTSFHLVAARCDGSKSFFRDWDIIKIWYASMWC